MFGVDGANLLSAVAGVLLEIFVFCASCVVFVHSGAIVVLSEQICGWW